eukprot:2106306-Lingulodinium_polyedra.AAC.1
MPRGAASTAGAKMAKDHANMLVCVLSSTSVPNVMHLCCANDLPPESQHVTKHARLLCACYNACGVL